MFIYDITHSFVLVYIAVALPLGVRVYRPTVGLNVTHWKFLWVATGLYAAICDRGNVLVKPQIVCEYLFLLSEDRTNRNSRLNTKGNVVTYIYLLFQ